MNRHPSPSFPARRFRFAQARFAPTRIGRLGGRLGRGVLLAVAAWGLAATPAARAEPARENVVTLNASASEQVRQDLLSVRLLATQEGPAAAPVQEALKHTLDGALAEVRKSAQEGAMDVRTGNFSLMPRYGRDGRVNGWVGNAELVLEGTDTARIAQAVARVSGMNVVETGYAVSRRERERHEAELTQQAIAAFRDKAALIAKSFGYGGFALGEVSVQSLDTSGGVFPRVMAMAKSAMASDAGAPLPTEAGRATLSVTVSGSVLLTR